MEQPQTPAPIAIEGVTTHQYAPYPDLRGKVAFVTGGASGIGAYLVHALAQVGAKTAFISLPSDPGEALCDAIAATGAIRPRFIPGDVRDLASLRQALEQTQAALGDVGILINNAARDDRHDLSSQTPEGWDSAMNVNLRPHFFAAQAVLPGMRRLGGGAIINVGSNSSLLGLSGYPAYVTAKAGIVGMTRALARELGVDAIRVNALMPGWVLTERQKALWATPEAVAACLEQQALKRTVAAEDIANAALFLASNAAAMITGQSLVVDGGRAMI
jgi:NAD(P)-dependent dehydrogenase (short-subunit alcohol dehydrogenase family)